MNRQNRRWRRENRARKRESDRRWRRNNPDKVRAYEDRYRENNPDVIRAQRARRRARKADAKGNFTADEFKRLCKKYDNKCLRCGEEDEGLTPDHVVPLSRGGSNWIENIQPLCKSCNSKKESKIRDYRKRGSVRRWIQKRLF